MKCIRFLVICLAILWSSASVFAADMGNFVEVKNESEAENIMEEKTDYEFKKIDNKYFVRINKGTEIVSALKEICAAENITAGSVSGIGAIESATFGFFNPKTKEYKEKTFSSYMEITSLLGNVSTKDDEVYLHLHMNASGNDYKTIGGHLVNAVVSATAEIVIDVANGNIGRSFDENIGLNLWVF